MAKKVENEREAFMAEKNKRRPPGAMTRQGLEALVWKYTPKDYRGLSEDGAREVMRPASSPGARVMRLSDMTESELYEQLPRGSVRAVTELEIYEVVPMADRKVWANEAVAELLARNEVRYENLAIEAARLSREGVQTAVTRQVREQEFRFSPLLGGRWVVGLPSEGRIETFAIGKKKR